MARPLLLAIGVVFVLFGCVFFLQGIDVLGGSGMSGTMLWSILGPIIALAGVGILVFGLRRRT
jgi:drug/metabolite transporter superfamily protein YnfA